MKTSNSQPLWKTSLWTHLPFANATYYTNMHNIQHLNNHCGKIEGFVIGLAIEFFNCNRHFATHGLYTTWMLLDMLQQLHQTPQGCIWYLILLNIRVTQCARCNCVAIGCPCQFFVQMFANKWNANLAFHSSIDGWSLLCPL